VKSNYDCKWKVLFRRDVASHQLRLLSNAWIRFNFRGELWQIEPRNTSIFRNIIIFQQTTANAWRACGKVFSQAIDFTCKGCNYLICFNLIFSVRFYEAVLSSGYSLLQLDAFLPNLQCKIFRDWCEKNEVALRYDCSSSVKTSFIPDAIAH